jgi:hypothetical protein
MRNVAAIVVTVSPINTGIRFRQSSSKGSTLQMAAAGISAQGIMTSLIPVTVKVLLMATIIEITRIVDINLEMT